MSARTVRSFAAEGDFWGTVDAWAAESRYALKESDQSWKLYQKGKGFWVAPMMVEIREAEGEVHIAAWIRVPLFTRLMALFMLPSEMGIESGGFRAVVPRNMARKAVNQLLEKLGQPPIP